MHESPRPEQLRRHVQEALSICVHHSAAPYALVIALRRVASLLAMLDHDDERFRRTVLELAAEALSLFDTWSRKRGASEL